MATRTHRTNYDIAATDSASAAFSRVQRAMQQTESVGKQLRNTLGSIGAGFSVGAFATALVTEAREAEQSSNRLVAVLRATGHAAGVTKSELDQMAESVQDALGFDDESVRNAQSTLLKFGNIQGDVFREAIRLSADLAAFMGTNIPEAAQILGKSLQSPTEGLTQMERQFGKLTDEQEKHIKSLVAQGRAIEAQNAVLDLWRSKIGGTAELMNTGLTKATRDVANAWSDMLEEMGRSGPVSRLVIDSLTGIRDILRDIQGLAAPEKENPLRRFNVELDEINEELERLNKKAAEPTTSAQRAGFGREASEAARKQIEDRIAFLRARGRQLVAEQRALAEAFADQANFEAGFANAGLPKVQLGGKTTDEAEEKRAREFLAKQLEESAEEEQKARSEAAALTSAFRARELEQLRKFHALDLQETDNYYEVGGAALIQNNEERIRILIERYDREQELAIENGEEILQAEEDRLKRLESLTKDLGFTFSSAFEDAIVGGKELREVLQGIAEDILRITVRRTATEPLAAALSGLISQSFGAGAEQLSGPPRADGGDVFPGVIYPVGERGPELFVPDRSGRIVPNHDLGGSVHIHQTNHFHGDFRLAARAEINSMLPQIAEASANAVQDRERRGRRV